MVDTPEVKATGAEDVIWDLSVFYSGVDDPAIKADMDKVNAAAAAFAEKYRGRVASLSAQELHDMTAEHEDIMDIIVRLFSFASLNYSTDSSSHEFGALVQKMEQFYAEFQQRMVFATLEWQEADPEHIEKVLADPAIGKYRHQLEAELRYKPYMLSEPEEQVIMAMGVNGRSAWTRFFSKLSSAMRYDWDGEKVTQSEILAKLYDSDREVRARASDSVTAGLREKEMELTYIFNVLASDKATGDKMRGYETWVSSRNLANKAPDEVVEALVATVTGNYDLVAQHYNIKAALLGIDDLKDYDRYAPLPLDGGDRSYQWGEAKDIVLTAFAGFSDRMAEIAGYFFEKNWIHAPIMPNKRGGAFCSSTTPTAHPFVFVNYLGKPRDVSTLAHELGHGVHGYLAGEAQGLFGADTPLTTAEMASTFAEMLVFTDLMEREQDPKVRLAMLVEKIEDTFATVFRQISMNRFEHAMHNAYREQGELSTEKFGELWIETQREMFGDSVEMTENYTQWWSYIPHFLHVPGYVYAYSFGELLVLALFELYKEQGDEFVPKYIDVLAAGGNDYPDKILAKAGVDLNDPNFWQGGINVIRDLIEQEQALARELYPEKF